MGYADMIRNDANPTDIREYLVSGEQTAIVNSTASTLNLRQGAGTEYPVLAEIPKGTSIIVTA